MTDDLAARHRAVLPTWMPLYYDQPIELVSGKGCRVTDAEGRSYLDFFGGVLTNSLGYDVAEVRDAVEKQLHTGIVHSSTLYLIRQQVELAEKIAKLSGIEDPRVFFTNSGSEANEAALLVATAFRRSNTILAVRNSYHGRTYATMGVTGNRTWSTSALNPLNVSFLHSGDRLRGLFKGLDDKAYIEAAVEDLREVLATTTFGDVACLIAEPIQGVGGFVHGPDGLFKAWQEVLAEHGILFVSDEVQTGWGRTGEHFWGYQAHGMTPDLVTFAKGVGNGFALAGLVGRADVLNQVQGISFSTFGGNPISTAAGNAVIDYIVTHDLQANCARVGQILFDGLRKVDSSVVVDVRGKGLMLAVELTDAAATAKVFELCKRDGLLVGKGGLYGNVIRMGPPMTLTEEEAKEGLGILGNALEEAAR
jgi:4-aminobutyrate aminotransferase